MPALVRRSASLPYSSGWSGLTANVTQPALRWRASAMSRSISRPVGGESEAQLRTPERSLRFGTGYWFRASGWLVLAPVVAAVVVAGLVPIAIVAALAAPAVDEVAAVAA